MYGQVRLHNYQLKKKKNKKNDDNIQGLYRGKANSPNNVINRISTCRRFNRDFNKITCSSIEKLHLTDRAMRRNINICINIIILSLLY